MGGWSRDWQAPGEQKNENTKLERGAGDDDDLTTRCIVTDV